MENSRSRAINSERFTSPLEVDFEHADEGYWIVTHPVVQAHGIGATEADAVNAFIDALASLYEELSHSETDLAPHLLQELDYLRRLFRDVDIETALDRMSADPNIQREVRAIEAEFSVTESDGLTD